MANTGPFTWSIDVPSVRQVYLHYTVRGLDETVYCSTRSEAGGRGVPQPFVLGKGMRMPRGWEIGLQSELLFHLQ